MGAPQIRHRIECQEIRFDIRKTWHRMNLSIRFPFVRCPSLVLTLAFGSLVGPTSDQLSTPMPCLFRLSHY
ncbi:hypothetical protein HZ326_29902 [Fusarium oxysporum f. sp. albedinis]|nr:hypothetical protein HZ326_29902 [Fusarium oxysporum f. sp. albedinis]